MVTAFKRRVVGHDRKARILPRRYSQQLRFSLSFSSPLLHLLSVFSKATPLHQCVGSRLSIRARSVQDTDREIAWEMPSVSVKLYSVFFKILLKHKLQSRLQVDDGGAAVADGFGVTSRPEENSAPANPSFGADGVATKDIHIDPLTSLAIRIFLPDPASQRASAAPRQSPDLKRRNSYGGSAAAALTDHARRSSYDGHGSAHDNGRGVASAETSIYRGYLPSVSDAHCRSGCWKKFPVIIQFHGGGFSTGSNTSKANDIFRRRMAKLCGAIVIAVGYSLAPESRYPAAFEDGVKVLHWLGKQARLAECRMAMTAVNGAVDEARKTQLDTFGVSTVEPWIL